MSIPDSFLYKELTPYDQIVFARSIQIALKLYGKDKCWCMKKNKHSIFSGFTTYKKNWLLYKGKDARPLLLSMTGRNPDPINKVIVRVAKCESKHCLNPSHYYWGTRADVEIEKNKRKKNKLNPNLITKLRQEKAQGVSSYQLAKTYKMSYQTVRRICNNETYEDVSQHISECNLKELWEKTNSICKSLISTNNTENNEFNLDYFMTEQLECPWHLKCQKTHKGNFGPMGECLDCMEEIKKGRCLIDVRNFEYLKWYWHIKSFWDNVDIGDDNECWEWLGATKKNNTESCTTFPSPFHSYRTQSASRVAFWISRDYTGKYRVFSKKGCKKFCCNPLHLTIKPLEDSPPPEKLEVIKLTHDNIFKHYKETNAKKK